LISKSTTKVVLEIRKEEKKLCLALRSKENIDMGGRKGR
jgi:hypothetical protein